MAKQYHFQFPSDLEARRFTNVIAWNYQDVALHRDGCWVSVIDGGDGGREQKILAAALRVYGMQPDQC